MLKWLGGCLVVVVVVIAAGSYWALRTMKETLGPDGSAHVNVAALPPRVFASLANADSLATWMAQGNTVTTSRHGQFQPGDTIRIGLRTSLGMRQEPMVWTVTQVIPDKLIVRELATRSSQRTMAIRRDSLAQISVDSTAIISSIISPLLDSLQRDRTTMTGEMMISMLRVQSKLELQSLKTRIESKPANAPPAAKR